MKRSAPHLLNALLCALLSAPMGATCVNAAELPIAGGARYNVPVHSLKELKFISTARQQ